MGDSVMVLGVGMVKFEKPGRHQPYEVMAAAAIREALGNAGVRYDQVGQAYASYAFGDSACGQTALYHVGMTGIPVVNVNNNCSSGSSALMLARQAVLAGMADCALAFGFEEMRPGAVTPAWTDRTIPLIELEHRLEEIDPDVSPAPNAHRLFGAAATSYIDQTGADPAIFAKVAVKSRAHALHNPLAIFDTPLTEAEVSASPVIFEPYLRRLEACPPSCGAAAAVVCSDDFARRSCRRQAGADPGPADGDRPVGPQHQPNGPRRRGHDSARGDRGLRAVRGCSGGHPGDRVARLLHLQRGHHL